MSELNEIISEMSNNITNVLSNSLKKILQREEETKNCLLKMPQIKDIIKTNELLKKYVEKLEIEKNMLKDENLKLQKILECYGEKFNSNEEKYETTNIKNISLDVSEKNDDIHQINMDVIKQSENLKDNKVIKLANLWQYENMSMEDTSSLDSNTNDETSEESDDDDDDDDDDSNVIISDYWQKQIDELNEKKIIKKVIISKNKTIEKTKAEEEMKQEETKEERIDINFFDWTISDEQLAKILDQFIEIHKEVIDTDANPDKLYAKKSQEMIQELNNCRIDENNNVTFKNLELSNHLKTKIEHAIANYKNFHNLDDTISDNDIIIFLIETSAGIGVWSNSNIKNKETKKQEENNNEDEDDGDEDDDDEEVELSEIEVKLPEHLKNSGIYDETTNLTSCYVDNEGTIYEWLDDDEIGNIIGKITDGIFFEC